MKYSYQDHIGLTNKYKDQTIGEAKLELYTVPENNFYAMVHGIPSGNYVRLYVGGELLMSNTRMEYFTQRDFMCSAYGDVVIGGLGLGAVVFGIQDKEEVTSITVLEKSQDVINLITSQVSFNTKVTIVCADVFEWVPKKDKKFDCVYMDIWPYINSDVYKEMLALKKRYLKFLKPKSISPNRMRVCWCEYEAKNNIPI